MSELLELGKNACDAKYVLQKLTTEEKNKALQTAANDLCERQEEILAANVLDLENGKNNGMNPGLLDRLKLTGERIAQIAEGLRQIAALPDCIGETMEHFERPNGLKIDKVRVPLGVIGIIYEARPNVTADAFGLCFKTGNAVILKGGSDAIHSNIAIVKVLQDALEACSMPRTAVQLIEDTDRAVTAQFMKMKEYVDVLIPRGGAGLIRSVVENSTIPVIETGTGNCHVYVDKDADVDMAVKILMNAKTQRIGVCNACESLVVHRAVRDKFLPKMAETLKTKNVELRGDESTREILPDCIPATEEDYGTEYLDYILSVKTVDSVEAVSYTHLTLPTNRQRGRGHCPYQPLQYEAFRMYRDGKYGDCREIFKRSGCSLCLCQCLHKIYRRFRVWIWRRNRYQHPEAACQRPHGPEGADLL